MRKIGVLFAAAALCATLAGCNKSSTSEAPAPGGDATVAPAPEAAAPLSDAEKATLLASLPAPYNTGDLANGEAKFALCQSCHIAHASPAIMTGPNLHEVFGRKAGTVEGFKYSDPLKASGIVWDAPKLDAWIADPHVLIPETKMTFAGLKDPKDRVDVVAYLYVASH